MASTRLKLSEPLSAAALLVLGVSCPLLLFAQPRALPPGELPSLVLPAPDVRAVLEQDAQRAARAPDSPAAKALETLMDAQGVAEQQVVEESGSYNSRRKRLSTAYERLVRESGEAAALDLRAKAVARFEAALDLKLPGEQIDAVMGVFPSVLQREGATRDGYLVAPRFLARTFYKSRWNLLCGKAADFALERIERRAFYGWQALHADRLPVQQRIGALAGYREAGGANAEEALAVLLYRGREWSSAMSVLTRVESRTSSLRVRNYLLGARAAADNANQHQEHSIPLRDSAPMPSSAPERRGR